MKKFLNKANCVLSSLIIILMMSGCKTSTRGTIDLEAGFMNPPDSAKPRVWWHWMNGNITKEGIHADLEWMHRIGIGGFQNFDAALNTPQIVEKRLVYMTPEWKDAFYFATHLADSLGLEMAIAGSPGWSESGGPWVKPEQAMKKYVWSETRVPGGKHFTGVLPQPFTSTGPFRNIRLRSGFSISGQPEPQQPEFYKDAAVIAYRLPEKDVSILTLKPKISSSGGKFNVQQLTDGDLASSSMLPPVKPGENAWIQYEFSEPLAVSSLTIMGGGFGGTFGFGGDPDNRGFEISADGKNFNKLFNLTRGEVEQKTLTFNPVTARFFRFTWKTPAPRPEPDLGSIFGLGSRRNNRVQAPSGTNISELVISPVPRINRFEEKAGFAAATDIYKSITPEIDPSLAVRKDNVLDLTAMMKHDGTLEWTPPEGEWMVVRLGYSLTGHRNSPASPEATGLEVDKFSAVHVRDYFTNYLDQYKDATKGLMGKRGLQFMITDSWEAGTQNWTDDMMSEFKKRRGYDMLPWMPVLTGHIVESSAGSEKFLWDFRKTIGELTTENHYDQLTGILKERGMARYSESHESGRAFIGDGMEVKSKAAIPMSATWTPGGLDPGTEVATRYKADVRESASVSHLYGQSFVAAESMTAIGSAWAWSPEFLKPTADMEMANGLNRFVIHTSVHQPVNDKIPGLGLGPFGQWFTRHETWAEQAGPWIKYLTRSCFMLQQGKFVADVAYFYGEDNNITALFGSELPDVPEGYNYDFINSDALINLLSVKDGKLVTPSGMTYSVLALDSNCIYMSLPVLKKINDLVVAGAIVSGLRPSATPSLSDDVTEFNSIAGKLWASEGVNIIGKGKVFTGKSLNDVLTETGNIPDFVYSGKENGTKLLFVHRRLGEYDIYWVNNRNGKAEDVDAIFRVKGKAPEIWHPENGVIEKNSFSADNNVTKVPLHLTPNDAIFVVFCEKTGAKSFTAEKPVEQQLLTVEGPWTVSFQEKRGAPAQATLETLTPWNENADKGIKYFSGTGIYSKIIQIPAERVKEGSRIFIDLGDVKNLAEIIVNGKSLGIAWKAPFRLDAKEAVKAGENKLEIKVTNLWVNRLIGEQQPDAKEKFTYTTMPFYRADSPLKPSGLIGPVKLFIEE